MNSMSFIKGMGIGIVVGSAIGMIAAPERKSTGRKAVGRALKSVGSVVEDITDVFGL